MMQKEQLTKYIDTIVNNNKQKYEFYFPGFFNDNHIFFVGICPNLPDKNTKFFEDMCFVRDSNNIQKAYEDKLLLTPLGQYIINITKSTKHISFSNFFKFATKDYESVDEETIKESKKILDQQIFLLQPNVVVLFGQWLGKQYNITNYYEYKKINDVYYVMVPHHSYANRTGQHNKIINDIKLSLNNFFKTHAITRVTDRYIYYRDCEFNKQKYQNTENDSFCFVTMNNNEPNNSEYKSFDGKNLKKVARTSCSENNSYERHLRKKDIWYYNNCKEIQHSKCLRALHYDIETNFCNDIINTPKEVISISFFDTFNKQFYSLVLNTNNQQVTTKFLNVKVKVFDDESKMLTFFFEIMKEFDIINGYYSNKFDFPYLIHRAKKLGINVEKYFEFLKIFVDNKEVEIKQEPYILYDTMFFYQKLVYVSKPPSFSLNNVSKYLFGDDVQKLDHEEGVDILWKNNINKLIEYNLQDVNLLKKICDKINAFMYPFRLQQIVPQDFENCFYNSKTIENMLHQEYWQKKVYFPTKIKHHKKEFEGALVLKPTAGIYNNVAVYDFNAMYTNIYLSFNISPDTLIGKKEQVEENLKLIIEDLKNRYPQLIEKFKDMSDEEIKNNFILLNTDFGQYYFLSQEYKLGILPELEMKALALRKYYVKERNKYDPTSPEYITYEDLQGTAKAILNSIYGITSYEKFILFNPIVSSSITTIARELNLWIQGKTQARNYKPLYSDTDSIFIEIKTENNTFEEVLKITEELENYFNNSFEEFTKQYTKNEYTIKNYKHHIECEKIFVKLLLTDVKKRYFGLVKLFKGKILEKPEMKVTGFEVRRDDTPNYFKKVLKQSYYLFLEDDYKIKLQQLYLNVKKEIKTLKTEDLIIKIKLSRDMDSYTNLPIHIRALKNSGLEIRRGEVINMIYVKDAREVLHYDAEKQQKFELDYDKYINNFFVNKLLLIDKSLNILLSSQTTLFNF